MNFTVSSISGVETYTVRHPILRAGRPIEDCYFEGDDLESTIHLGLFVNNDLIAVGTFLMNKDATILELQHHVIEQCYQLRGMAVLEKWQGQHIGKRLMLEAEQLLLQKGVTALWFNARIKAIPFYKKLGYQKVNEEFHIPQVGPHFKMYKSL